MAQVKMKKFKVQEQLQNVAEILQQVDKAVSSVRQKLFELENWKANLINKIHACQIELMGLDPYHQCSHEQNVTLAVTQTESENSQDPPSGNDNVRKTRQASRIPDLLPIPYPVNLTNGTREIPQVDSDDYDIVVENMEEEEEDSDSPENEEEEEEEEEEEKEKENEQILEHVMEEENVKTISEQSELESKINGNQDNHTLEQVKPKPLIIDLFKKTPIELTKNKTNGKDFKGSESKILNNNVTTLKESSSSVDKTNNHEPEIRQDNETTIITTSPAKASIATRNSRRRRTKTLKSSSSSHDLDIIVLSHTENSVTNADSNVVDTNVGTIVDKREGMNFRLCLHRLNLPPGFDRFVYESPSNTWTPIKITNKPKRGPKSRRSRDTISDSDQMRQESNVQAQRKRHKRGITNEKKSSPMLPIKRPRRLLPSVKNGNSENGRVIKQDQKIKKIETRGRPRFRQKGENKKPTSTTTTTAKNKVTLQHEVDIVIKKRRKKDSIVPSTTPLPKKTGKQPREKKSRKKSISNLESNSSLQLPTTPIYEITEENDESEDFAACTTSEASSTVITAMTINHSPGSEFMSISTDDQFDSTLPMNFWENELQNPSAIICHQCGDRCDSLEDFKMHELMGKCTVPVLNVTGLEFQELDSSSPSLVRLDDDPFVEYRYGEVQSGDEIPYMNEEEVINEVDETIEEKVLIRPRDPNFMIWDGLVSETFNEVDVQEESIPPPTMNGIHHVPIEVYPSSALSILSHINPFSP